MERKSAGVAAVLSAVFNGLGQIYNGHILKGIFFFVWQAINLALTTVLIGYLFIPIVWLICVFDAHRSANRINRRFYRDYY